MHALIMYNNSLFRAGLRSVLKHHGIEVDESVEQEQALQIVSTKQSVVILESTLTWPCHTTLEIAFELRVAGAGGILVIGPALKNEASLFRLLVSGVAGYELPTIGSEDLVEKVRRVANGEHFLTEEVLLQPHTQPVAPEYPDKKEPELPVRSCQDAAEISEAELTVLRYIALGYSNRQISIKLHVNPDTVRSRIRRIFNKLSPKRDRTDAVMNAIRQGLPVLATERVLTAIY